MQEEGQQGRLRPWRRPAAPAADPQPHPQRPVVLLLTMGSLQRPMQWLFYRRRGLARTGLARISPAASLHCVHPHAILHAILAAVPAAVPTAACAIMGPSRSGCSVAADVAAGNFSKGDGLWCLHPYALLGWYASLSLTCFACFYFTRQWFTYSGHVSRSIHPSHQSIKFRP